MLAGGIVLPIRGRAVRDKAALQHALKAKGHGGDGAASSACCAPSRALPSGIFSRQVLVNCEQAKGRPQEGKQAVAIGAAPSVQTLPAPCPVPQHPRGERGWAVPAAGATRRPDQGHLPLATPVPASLAGPRGWPGAGGVPRDPAPRRRRLFLAE